MTNVQEIFPNRNRSNGFNYVIDFDLAELRNLSVRERVQPFTNNPVYPARFPQRSKVPFQLSTLNETLELLLGLNRATSRQRELLIEIKKPEYHFQYGKSISAIVLATLNAYNLTGATDPVLIQSFHIEELMHIRRNLGSQLRLFALMTWNRVNESSSDYDFYRSEQGIRNLSQVVQALAPDYQLVVNFDSNGMILNPTNLTRWAHQYNISVYPYTFRQDLFLGGSFKELVEYFWHTVQVDGFITDHSDVILDLLHSKEISMSSTMFHPSFLFCLFALIASVEMAKQ